MSKEDLKNFKFDTKDYIKLSLKIRLVNTEEYDIVPKKKNNNEHTDT